MKITPINNIKYTPVSFKAETTKPAQTYTTTVNSNSDTFEKSTQPAQTTVNKVLTSFKKLFDNQTTSKGRSLSDQEISDMIFSRNLLL